MLVPCPHRGDHMIRPGFMHGPDRCPPPRGHHGDHHSRRRRRKRIDKKIAKAQIESRGAPIAGTGKPAASSDKTAKKKQAE